MIDFNFTVQHYHDAGGCNAGGRRWFELHGFSWSDFVFHGISSLEIFSTGDSFAINFLEKTLLNMEK